MAENFTWIDGERLVRFGRGAALEAGALLAERGFRGFVLLTTPRAETAVPGLAAAAADVRHVPAGGVPEAAAAVRGGLAGRPLVALGGGRVLDAAKAVAGADGNECAAIPTTLAGAEMTRLHRMPAGVDEFTLVRPSLVIADPELMASQPMPGLAGSAMNALAHAFEALFVPLRNPVADAAALAGAHEIGRGLRAAEPDRHGLALGALLGAYALGASDYAVHHVVCQTLVRVCGSPHAETNSVMLPHSVALMERRAPAAVARFVDALGCGPAELATEAGLPASLSQIGVGEGGLDEVVELALARPQLANTPQPPDAAELRRLLQAAL